MIINKNILVLVSLVFLIGFTFGKVKIVEKKTEEIDTEVQEVIEKREADQAAEAERLKYRVALGEWKIIDEYLVILGIGNKQYLMWPRLKLCPATNNNEIINWKNSDTAGQPVWDDSSKTYIYPNGETKIDYPAFYLAEDSTYKGYVDWRIPTIDELIQLYNEGEPYVNSMDYLYWSSSESSENVGNAWRVDFTDGRVREYKKNVSRRVRFVRKGIYIE